MFSLYNKLPKMQVCVWRMKRENEKFEILTVRTIVYWDQPFSVDWVFRVLLVNFGYATAIATQFNLSLNKYQLLEPKLADRG